MININWKWLQKLLNRMINITHNMYTQHGLISVCAYKWVRMIYLNLNCLYSLLSLSFMAVINLTYHKALHITK